MHSGSPLDPWGPRGQSGSLGVSKSNFIKSKSFTNKGCQVCFRGDKKSFGVTFWPLRVQAHLGRPLGGQKISSNQKFSLTNVVRHVSGVTKTSQAPARLGPKQLCISRYFLVTLIDIKISLEDVDFYAKLSLILNTPDRNSKTQRTIM